MFNFLRLRPSPPTPPIVRGVIYYRTKNGRSDYGFNIARLGNGQFRIYIVSQPSYGSRSTGAHPTHRLNDGRPYICWDSPITSEEQARQIAAIWADKTEDYILHGTRF